MHFNMTNKRSGEQIIVVFNDIRAVSVIFNMLQQIVHKNS
jgi:hypothetical protein